MNAIWCRHNIPPSHAPWPLPSIFNNSSAHRFYPKSSFTWTKLALLETLLPAIFSSWERGSRLPSPVLVVEAPPMVEGN